MGDDPAKYSQVEVFAVYRKEEHGKTLREMGHTPVKLDLSDASAIKSFIIDHNSEERKLVTHGKDDADLPLSS
jgi:hypothetical protein